MIDWDEIAAQLESRVGYRFARTELLESALTHSSVAQRETQIERYEFLGDAVLSLSVSDLLLRAHPQANEGRLTMLRARLVNTQSLARKAAEIGLDGLIVLGKGEEKTGGREKPSILAGVFEAVLGAVYLDGGFGVAHEVVTRLFAAEMVGQMAVPDEDAKTSLQELTQRVFKVLPLYATLQVEGPDHARDFAVEVSVGGRVLGHGKGRSKRVAAQHAAREALEVLKLEGAANSDDDPPGVRGKPHSGQISS